MQLLLIIFWALPATTPSFLLIIRFWMLLVITFHLRIITTIGTFYECAKVVRGHSAAKSMLIMMVLHTVALQFELFYFVFKNTKCSK